MSTDKPLKPEEFTGACVKYLKSLRYDRTRQLTALAVCVFVIIVLNAVWPSSSPSYYSATDPRISPLGEAESPPPASATDTRLMDAGNIGNDPLPTINGSTKQALAAQSGNLEQVSPETRKTIQELLRVPGEGSGAEREFSLATAGGQKLKWTGVIRPYKEVDISGEIPAVLTAQLIKAGGKATNGQIIARLDDRNLLQQQKVLSVRVKNTGRIDDARASLDFAERRVEIVQKLIKLKSATREDLASAQLKQKKSAAELTTALARHEEDKLQLSQVMDAIERANIKAPFDGVVEFFYREESEYVRMGDKLLRFIDTSKVYLVINLPASELGQITKGMRAEISIDERPEHEFEGTVDFIEYRIQDVSSTVAVKLLMDNNKDLIRPGMQGTAELTPSRTDAKAPNATAARPANNK